MKKVYHGSIVDVVKPLVSLGRPNLDFGQGFYLTDLEDLAKRWAVRIGTRKMEKTSY